MSGTVSCTNPAHGVKNHQAGTRAAKECTFQRGLITTETDRSLSNIPLSSQSGISNADNQEQLMSQDLPSAPRRPDGAEVIFTNDRPDWTYGSSHPVPVGTYAGDDQVQITEFPIEGEQRSNFMFRRGIITGYVERPDMAGVFTGITGVNAKYDEWKGK